MATGTIHRGCVSSDNAHRTNQHDEEWHLRNNILLAIIVRFIHDHKAMLVLAMQRMRCCSHWYAHTFVTHDSYSFIKCNHTTSTRLHASLCDSYTHHIIGSECCQNTTNDGIIITRIHTQTIHFGNNIERKSIQGVQQLSHMSSIFILNWHACPMEDRAWHISCNKHMPITHVYGLKIVFRSKSHIVGYLKFCQEASVSPSQAHTLALRFKWTMLPLQINCTMFKLELFHLLLLLFGAPW